MLAHAYQEISTSVEPCTFPYPSYVQYVCRFVDDSLLCCCERDQHESHFPFLTHLRSFGQIHVSSACKEVGAIYSLNNGIRGVRFSSMRSKHILCGRWGTGEGDYRQREKPRIHQAPVQNPLGSTEDGMMLARKSKEKMEGMTGLRVEQELQSEGSVLHNAERTHTSSVSQLCPMRCSQSRLLQKVMKTSQSEDLTRGTTSKSNLYLGFNAVLPCFFLPVDCCWLS